MVWRWGTDQLGRSFTLQAIPIRIVSLVPSQTELLYDLGLEREVVGITKFCVHPEVWLKTKRIVGGTKNFDLSIIKSLQPDLIIGNKEENPEDLINALTSEFPVWMSDVSDFSQALEMIVRVGEITNREAKALVLKSRIIEGFENLKTFHSKKVLYLIWRKPWMGVGSHTFINDLICRLGWVNVLASEKRYPELTDESIKKLDPEIVLLPSEPFPFSDNHVREIQNLLPHAKIMRVDGEMFSWYGSRMVLAPGYLESMKKAFRC